MSRWRETLCGKVVVGKAPPSPLEQLGATSQDVLSCGGVYVPQSAHKTQKQNPDFIFLPKSNYEMLRFEADKDMARYGEAYVINDEEAMTTDWSFDTEAIKFTR